MRASTLPAQCKLANQGARGGEACMCVLMYFDVHVYACMLCNMQNISRSHPFMDQLDVEDQGEGEAGGSDLVPVEGGVEVARHHPLR